MILRIRDADGKVQEIAVIKGEKGTPGDDYVLTDADKQEIAELVKNLFASETWTFTLSDGSTVTKAVILL